MTKEEYLKNITPHEVWSKWHDEIISKAIKEMKPYFDADRFIAEKNRLASESVLKNILAEAFLENNSQCLGEMENYISRMLSLPYEEVVEYRTELFWQEIKDE